MIEKLLNAGIIEHAVNTALKLDPQAAVKLAALDGAHISLALDFAPHPWIFAVDGAHLSLIPYTGKEECDVRLSGSLIGFLRAFRGKKDQDRPAKENALHIEGDLYTAQTLQRVMAELSPDFDGVLRERFGDGLGGFAADAFRQIREYGDSARDKAEEALKDWVGGEEGFVGHDEFREQKSRVNDLLKRLDQLEHRLSQREKA